MGVASADLPRKHTFCLVIIPGQHPERGPKGLGHMPEPFARADTTPFQGHCLLTEVEVQAVLPTVLGLVPVGEVAIKRGSLEVLDFGLDVFGHVADS